MERAETNALPATPAQGETEKATAETQKLHGPCPETEPEAQEETQEGEQSEKEAAPSEVEEKTWERDDDNNRGDVGWVYHVDDVDNDGRRVFSIGDRAGGGRSRVSRMLVAAGAAVALAY